MKPDKQKTLSYAASIGDIEAISALVAEGADIDARSDYGNPLHNAVENEQYEAVRYLVQAGADPDLLHNGFRPLHHAIDLEMDGAAQSGESANAEMTKLLVELGADINGLDYKGRTPLKMAIERQHEIAVVYLRSKGAA